MTAPTLERLSEEGRRVALLWSEWLDDNPGKSRFTVTRHQIDAISRAYLKHDLDLAEVRAHRAAALSEADRALLADLRDRTDERKGGRHAALAELLDRLLGRSAT